MIKINRFNILSVRMEGFKKFKDAYTMDFDKLTCISGSNGEGKTSIADAIAFAFCGTPFWGEKSCDRLLNSESKEMSVSIQIVDENGEVHTLSRTKYGNNTTIIFDTLQVRQTDLTTMFAEKDVFLSLINPIYFIEKIAEDGREFLQKLVPQPDQSEILAQMSESTRALLESESLLDPEYFIKKRREELKALEDADAYLAGQKDLLKAQFDDTSSKMDDVLKKGDEIVRKKQSLEEKQFAGIDVEKLRARQAAIAESLSGEVRTRLAAKQAEAQNRQYISKFTPEIAEIEAEIRALSERCNRLVTQMKGIKVGDTCPTCHTTVTEANYKSIIAGMKADYDKACSDGKAAIAARAELLALDKKSKEKFEEFRQADLKRVEAERSELGTADVSEIALIEDKLKFGNLTPEEYDELCALTTQAESYLKEVEVLCAANDIPGKIEKIDSDLAQNKTKKIDLLSLIHAVTEYMAKRAEITLQSLQMNRASIKLFDVVKTTGELKNVFRFTYDGKDYRWLSTSERIKAGLEVSALLERLTGLIYPKYIDNAECITTKLDRINGQAILAYARKTPLVATYPLRQVAAQREAVAA